MKKYIPEEMVKISRYQNYFPSLPAEIQHGIFAGMKELIEEEKDYCDKGNYEHMAQILTSIAMYEAFQKYTDFIRTKTLCQGGDYCDFYFVRHDTDAGDGWERTRSI